MLRKIIFACFLCIVILSIFSAHVPAQPPSVLEGASSSVSFQWIRIGFDSTQNRFRIGWMFENTSSESRTFRYRIISGCKDTITGVMSLATHLHRMGGAFCGCDSIAGITITPTETRQLKKKAP